MIEKKTLTLQDGVLINVGRLEFEKDENGNEIIPPGITFEEREMEYSAEYGWREVGYKPPKTDGERIVELEVENVELKQLSAVNTDYLVDIDYRLIMVELGIL